MKKTGIRHWFLWVLVVAVSGSSGSSALGSQDMRLDCPDGGPAIIYRVSGSIVEGHGAAGCNLGTTVWNNQVAGDALSWDSGLLQFPNQPTNYREAQTAGQASAGRLFADVHEQNWVSNGGVTFRCVSTGTTVEVFVRGNAGTPYRIERTLSGFVHADATANFCAGAGGCIVQASQAGYSPSSYGVVTIDTTQVFTGTTSGGATSFPQYPGVPYCLAHAFNAGGTCNLACVYAPTPNYAITEGSVHAEFESEIARGLSPIADIAGPGIAENSVPVSFSAAASFDPDGGPLEYLWSAEGSPTINGVNDRACEMTWAQPDTYTVFLAVTDCDARRGTATHEVEVVNCAKSADKTPDCDGTYNVTIDPPVVNPVWGGFWKDVLQVFRVSGVFSESPPSTGTIKCCEYWQYRKDMTRYLGYGPSSSPPVEDTILFQWPSNPCPNTRYGHRSDANCARVDEYSDPDRATGRLYRNQDGPGNRMPGHGKWIWEVLFFAKTAHPGGACCAVGDLEQEEDWSTCIEQRADGTYRDCSHTKEAEREPAQTLGCNAVDTNQLLVEGRLEACLQARSDTLGVIITADARTGDLDTLSIRALQATVAVEGLTSVPNLEPFRYATQIGNRWVGMYFFEKPIVLPSLLTVTLNGLESPVVFRIPATGEPTGVQPEPVPTVGGGSWGIRSLSPSTVATVDFSLSVPRTTRCTVQLYSIRGELVRTIFEGELAAGERTASWDGRDEKGMRVSAGVYLARISGGGESATTKVLVLK